MNDDIQHAFTKFRPIYDGRPDAPNILMQAVRGNFFNSVLSSFGTAAQALYGKPWWHYCRNLLLTLQVHCYAVIWIPFSVAGWAYSAMWDTQKKAMPYAGKLFAKASQNPNAVKGQN